MPSALHQLLIVMYLIVFDSPHVQCHFQVELLFYFNLLILGFF